MQYDNTTRTVQWWSARSSGIGSLQTGCKVREGHRRIHTSSGNHLLLSTRIFQALHSLCVVPSCLAGHIHPVRHAAPSSGRLPFLWVSVWFREFPKQSKITSWPQGPFPHTLSAFVFFRATLKQIIICCVNKMRAT